MKKILTLFLILLLLAGWIVVKNNTKKDTLDSPTMIISSPSPSPTGFKFDRATDLKKELDKIDPQILDSDFDT